MTAYIPRHPSDPGESLRTLMASDLEICLEANSANPTLTPAKPRTAVRFRPPPPKCLGAGRYTSLAAPISRLSDWCARAAYELVIHSHDVGSGLGVALRPPVEICRGPRI